MLTLEYIIKTERMMKQTRGYDENETLYSPPIKLSYNSIEESVAVNVLSYETDPKIGYLKMIKK